MDMQLATAADVGDLSELETDDKTSLVNAINEVKHTGGTGTMQELTVYENGTYVPDYPYSGFGTVTVDVGDMWIRRMKMARGLFSHELHLDFDEINLHDIWSAAYMFENCIAMERMTIHASCIDHMPGMFYRCTSLEDVVFDCDSFERTSLIDKADNCYSTTDMSVRSDKMFAYSSTDRDLKVHFRGKPWFKSTFYYCYAGTLTVTTDYEGTATVAGESAFRESRMKKISIPDVKIYNFEYGCQTCGSLKTFEGGDWSACTSFYRAFESCSAIESIDAIDNAKFSKCTNFQYAFRYCSKLKHIELDVPVCRTFDGAFNECYALEIVKLKNLGGSFDTTAFSGTFGNCQSLKNLYISSLKGMAANYLNYITSTFTNCYELTDFIIDDEETTEISLYIKQSPKLSEESVDSIIRSLKTRTSLPSNVSSLTGVLTLSSAVALTDEQRAVITAKNWMLG